MAQDQVGITFENDTFVITGELNFSNVMSLYQKSLPQFARAQKLVFDLAKLKSINSIGLALIIDWINYAKSQNKHIEFHNIPADLLSLAKVSGIDALIPE